MILGESNCNLTVEALASIEEVFFGLDCGREGSTHQAKATEGSLWRSVFPTSHSEGISEASSFGGPSDEFDNCISVLVVEFRCKKNQLLSFAHKF